MTGDGWVIVVLYCCFWAALGVVIALELLEVA